MADQTSATQILSFIPAVPIPDYLVGEVQSKLAYVDETIENARVSASGDRIELDLRHPENAERQAELQEQVQRVVISMAKGAFKPKIQILEDHLDRPVPYQKDPMQELSVPLVF